MRTEQTVWNATEGWSLDLIPPGLPKAQLVLMFGSVDWTECCAAFGYLRTRYPEAHIFGCSTAGEICGTHVQDGTVVATAVEFEHTRLAARKLPLAGPGNSAEIGEALARSLDCQGLVHVLVLSDGLHVNGSELAKGLASGIPSTVVVTGGLAADGDRFGHTAVCLDGPPEEGSVGIIGFYGDRLRIGYGSMGGWDQFGPDRRITRSEGNVLYELDGRPALELYKTYLGKHAADLPASGLLFPLSLRTLEGKTGVVRTILAIDENEGSLTFAGDMPEGAHARLMRANIDRLIDGATGAATASHEVIGAEEPQLAVLISCVGRKLVLKQRVEEEVESVREVLGPSTTMTGFYSYGEISPLTPGARCELHNQTMTITTFAER